MNKYRLEKIKINEGNMSAISEGSSVESTKAYFFITEDDPLIESPKLSDIKEGGRLLVYENYFYFIKTSDIINILEVTDASIKFETTTSVYLLEISDE